MFGQRVHPCGLLGRSGNDDLGHENAHTATLCFAQSAVDFSVGDLHAAGIAGTHQFTPPDRVYNEIAKRFARDAGLTKRLGKFFGAQIRARGEFGKAVFDTLRRQFDARFGHGLVAQAFVDQRGQRPFAGRPRCVQHFKKALALLDFEFGYNGFIHLGDGRKEVLRRNGGGGHQTQPKDGDASCQTVQVHLTYFPHDRSYLSVPLEAEKPRRPMLNPISVEGSTLVEEV